MAVIDVKHIDHFYANTASSNHANLQKNNVCLY